MGSCQPEDCFWGDNRDAVVSGESSSSVSPELTLEWEFESSASTQRIRLMSTDHLQVDTHMQLHQADIEYDVTDHFKRTPEQGS